MDASSVTAIWWLMKLDHNLPVAVGGLVVGGVARVAVAAGEGGDAKQTDREILLR
jgi:hypothetical protein